MHKKERCLTNLYGLLMRKNLFCSGLIALVYVSNVNGQDYGYNTNGKCIYQCRVTFYVLLKVQIKNLLDELQNSSQNTEKIKVGFIAKVKIFPG